MTDSSDPITYLPITADIVASYLSNNHVSAAEIPGLIATVHEALRAASNPAATKERQEPPKPAVSVKKSVQDEYLVSLEDGKRYKTLKRHLAGLGMTPDDYRTKWGLTRDYPIVAPSYARRRSELAKAAGLGQLRRKPEPEAAPAPEPVEAKRSRKKAPDPA